MHAQQEILALEQRILELEAENARLNTELDFLKIHPTIAQGIKGETLIAQLVDGVVTAYSDSYDLLTSTGLRIEVKYSKLNHPMKVAPTKRWNWGKPLGWLDKGKDYHYLLLIGEKDPRYLDQYPDDTPYVYFLVPLQDVRDVMSQGKTIGGMIQTTTNLAKLEKKQNRPHLLNFQIDYSRLKPLLTKLAKD
ncbi:MAG: bZIP transcription factor [Candidatus Accumulibacter sp. UW26]|jgi:hypothetical protein